MPVPKPMLATRRASGARNWGSAAASTMVISSGAGGPSSVRTEPSGLPLVRSVMRCASAVTLTVAVLPSRCSLSACRSCSRLPLAVHARGHVVGARARSRTARPAMATPAAAAEAGTAYPASRPRREQRDAEREVDRGAGDDQPLQAEQGEADVHRDDHPGDRAGGVRGIHLADRALARALAQQRGGDQRQRHAGAERRREHHRERDRVARHVEGDVAGLARRQHRERRLHQAEARAVHRQRGERRDAHRQLHERQKPHGIARRCRCGAVPTARRRRGRR